MGVINNNSSFDFTFPYTFSFAVDRNGFQPLASVSALDARVNLSHGLADNEHHQNYLSKI